MTDQDDIFVEPDTGRAQETEPAASGRFLDVRDLRVHFPTDDGVVKSVDGLSFQLDRGKTLGIVGESGSGKSVTSLSIMGLHKAGTAQISGEIMLNGTNLVGLGRESVRRLRGKDMAMIFQDPLSSMHPYYSVGNQIIEAYRIHHDVSKQVARKHAIDMLDRV
ncbi:MAG TPA: ATP-binding cassette domain-containing protein, partial [Kribbella sp.]